jgi:cytochrome c-type biogenesis protein CcmH
LALSLLASLLVAVAGYAWKGQPQLIGAMPPPPAVAEAGMDAAKFNELADKLRERLKGEPDNAEGWGMLARAYLMLERAEDALPAFERATQLQPKDAGMVADHAVALGLKNGRSLKGEPAKLIQRALAIDPDNVRALSLAGSLALEEGNAKQAVVQWTKALNKAGADSELGQQLSASIAQAQQTGAPNAAPNESPRATPSTPAAASTDKKVVRGEASLSPKVRAAVADDDTVFIVARAAQGQRIPLAVLRKKVRDLPLNFTLDDSLAMSPQLTVSSVDEVVVSVRVSKSGNATPQEGDHVGTSAAVRVGGDPVKVVVDSGR